MLPVDTCIFIYVCVLFMRVLLVTCYNAAIWRNKDEYIFIYKKHLKNVGPIRHNEPPHSHSADVASGTVARRLLIDVNDDNDNDNA